ncbi:MAG TPA: hypothetical protein VGR38_08910, partial [Candidatus Polarisedimenticolia bacterium]|nr:hypothetical protein [Candidatus Polarisedimenticolia bacterium]
MKFEGVAPEAIVPILDRVAGWALTERRIPVFLYDLRTQGASKVASGRHAEQGNVLLDWFTVSYKTIVLSIVFLVGVSGAIFLFFYLRSATGVTPEGLALHELTRAERMFSEAESAAHEEQFEHVINQAGRLLESARRSYRARNFTESRTLSQQSQAFSRKILDVTSAESSFTAKIYRFEGDVKIKRVKQFVWENINSNVALKVGDQIKTSSGGSAQI